MLKKAIRTSTWSIILMTILAATFGGYIAGWQLAGIAKGAVLGLVIGCATAIHLVFRTINRRAPEAHTPELEEESVEYQLLQRAGAGAFTDTISLGILACIVAFASPISGVGLYALLGLLLASIMNFGIRATVLWRRGGA
ncbi:hypothetical protein [Cryobacterium sp. PH31-L1]|uniref:hypothetical protein n=1 Tax=Cryobacterium sp. PH31-L1 TaxID=3046199 RepID=UPI0024BAD35E|nr:hypothetical protein [Cryobacterium sp. PH31-L1]MDJ0376265.1 hypothetical protein [Cryobacterium sp. PH31-L1]